MTYNAQLRACCVAWRRAGDGGVLGRCTGPSELEMAHVINQIVVVVIVVVEDDLDGLGMSASDAAMKVRQRLRHCLLRRVDGEMAIADIITMIHSICGHRGRWEIYCRC